MSELLSSKIAEAKRKHAMVALGTGAALSVSALVGILVVTMMTDWLIELSYWVRAALLAVNLSASVFIVVRWIVVPMVYGPDDEQVSLWVEEREPAFASRLITAVQLSREEAVATGTSRPMLAAMVRQTEQLAEPVDFAAVVSSDRLLKLMSGAILLVVLALVTAAVGGQTAQDLLKRALLVPGVEVPRKTRVRTEQGDLIVARGDDVVLGAVAEGIIPDSGRIVIRYDSGREQTIAIEPADRDEAADVFRRTIQNVPESFRYTIHLNDGHSQEHYVRAETRPAVTGIEIQQIFPAYTGLPPTKRSTGDLSILEGSRLVVRVQSNKAVKRTGEFDPVRNHVHLAGSETRYGLVADPDDPTRLVAIDGGQQSIPLPKVPAPTSGLSVHLVDEYGLESKNPVVYRVDLLPDRAPTVRVTHPQRKEELVTSRATIVAGFDAADDFAIGSARIAYEIRQPGAMVSDEAGLTAAYYDAPDFTDRKVERVDRTIDFRWNHEPPQPQMDKNHFSIRWTGYLVPPTDGTYAFVLDVDDGVRLWIDDQQLLDSWKHIEQLRPARPVQLTAGQPYRIRLDYWQNDGPARCRLLLQQGSNRVVVPASMLWPTLEALDQSRLLAEGRIELDVGSPRPRSLRGHHVWDLSRLEPRPPLNSIIEWWVEVEDTNNVTGPGLATSERFLARIVSDAEKRADLMRRLDDTWNPIGTVTEDQEKLNRDLGQMIIEQGKDGK